MSKMWPERGIYVCSSLRRANPPAPRNKRSDTADTHRHAHTQKMPKAKPKVWSAEKSGKSLRQDAIALAKATNTAWAVAKKAPLFLRKSKFVGSGKSKKRATMTNRFGVEVPVPQRANRCFRTATLKTLLSGAAASVNELLKGEAEAMKTKVTGEASVAASLPKLSIGAEIELEHALAAYTQTIFDAAVQIKDSMSMHSKVSAGCMSAACDIVNKNVFTSSTLAPGAVCVGTKRRIVNKKTKAPAEAAGADKSTAAA